MKKCIIFLLSALLIVLPIPTVTAAAAENDPAPVIEETDQPGGMSLEDWNFELDEDAGDVVLTKYIGEAAVVEVPDSFEIDEQSYDTVLASETVFRANADISSVTLSYGVRFSNNSMRLLFGECSALTEADFFRHRRFLHHQYELSLL